LIWRGWDALKTVWVWAERGTGRSTHWGRLFLRGKRRRWAVRGMKGPVQEAEKTGRGEPVSGGIGGLGGISMGEGKGMDFHGIVDQGLGRKLEFKKFDLRKKTGQNQSMTSQKCVCF